MNAGGFSRTEELVFFGFVFLESSTEKRDLAFKLSFYFIKI